MPFLSKGQSAGDYASQALKLEQESDYLHAATLWEKAVFDGVDDTLKQTYVFSRAMCFKHAGEYMLAEKTFRRIERNLLTDSMQIEVLYQSSLVSFLQGHGKSADLLLSESFSIAHETATSHSSLFLHALVLNSIGEFSQAKSKLKQYAGKLTLPADSIASVMSAIDELYDDSEPEIKRLAKARKLSMFLPGAGLFYSGYPGKAFVNIGLQVASLGFIGYNVLMMNYFTAATAGVKLFLLFYTGGVNQLEYLVNSRNEQVLREFNSLVKDFMLRDGKTF